MEQIIYLVAGEASGDAHGYDLMQSLLTLDCQLKFAGAGGPAMEQAASGSIVDWSDHAVIGVVDVLKNYGYFKGQMDRMLAEIKQLCPGAIVLIDYPGFNLRLAARLRAQGYSGKIIYYISPQVWAWNRGRIPKMAEILDLMLCIFPFEPPLYEKSGLSARFVGHPMVDKLNAKRSGTVRDPSLIALLPGSRLREVKRIFPTLLKCCKLLQNRGLKYAASAPKAALAGEMQAMAEAEGIDTDTVEVGVGNAYELMQEAGAGLVASGTATLESAFFGLPFALVYKVSWATYWPAKLLVKVPYIGMVNILAERQVVAEYIQARATPESLAREIELLLDQQNYRQGVLEGCRAAVAKLGGGGASDRAAQYLLEEIY